MPGDAGSAVIKIKTSIDWGDLSSLESKINSLENTPHTIKVKVEAADGQKGLNNLINGLDKAGREASKNLAGGVKNAASNMKNAGSGAKDVADNFKKAGKNANVLSASSKQIKKDSDEYVTALKAANNAIDSMKKNISKMQDAGLGDAKSRKEFENYNKQLEEMIALRDKLGDPHGNQTNNSFNRYFNAITGSANRSLQEIKKNGEYTNEVTNQIIKGHEAATKAAEKRARSEAKIESDRVRNLQKQEEAERKAYEQKGIREVEEQARQEKERKKLQQEVLNDIAKGEQQETQRQLKEAKERAKNDKLLAEDSVANYKAQQQILSRKAQIDKELSSWTAAANDSRTSQSYKDLQKLSEELSILEARRKDGSLSNGDYAEELNRISAAAQDAEANIQHFNKDRLSFGDKIKNAFSDLSRYITPYMVMTKAIQTVKQMAQASMDIESAMTRIQIVTGATNTQMSQFFETAAAQGQELGKSITDVAGSIETFSRLGYTLNEATGLSKFANIMANVGDVSVDEATTGLTSIIKGFNLEASDAEHVSDVLIEVGQKYAISASELMQAFERGGAAMHASGASFEESAALFAATNAALQNSAKTGTMWNTVSARMRNSKAELDELGESYDDLAGGFSKYRDEVLALSGVDIMKGSGEFKNPYEIMTELAEAWDNINGEPAQARLAEIFAGTRQLSGFMSTITNIKDATKALVDAQNAEGVALEANNLYMDTTAAHVEQLKAAFQELSYDTLNGDLMKGFVDFGKGSLNVIDGVIDKVGTLGTALAAISAATFIKGLSKTSGIKSLADLGTVLTGGVGAFGPIAGITAGVAAVAGIYNAYKKYQENLRINADNAADSFFGMEDAIDKSITKAKELRSELDSGTLTDQQAYEAKKELLDIQNQLAESYPKIADGIDLVNGSMEKQVTLTDQLLQKEADQILAENAKAFEEAEKYMNTPVDDIFGWMPETSEVSKGIQNIANNYKDFIKLVPDGNGGLSLAIVGDNPQEAHEHLAEFASDILKLRDSYKEGTSSYDLLTSISRGAESELQRLSKGIGEYSDRAEQAQKIRLYSDKDLYGTPNKSNQKTALQWTREYESAINDLNEALLSGDTSKIKEASDAFYGIDSTIQTLLSHTNMGKFSDIFAEIGEQLQTTMLAYSNLERILGGDISAGGISKQNIGLLKIGQRIKDLGLTSTEFAERYLDITNRASNNMVDIFSDTYEQDKQIVDFMTKAKALAEDSGIDIELEPGVIDPQFLSMLSAAGILTSDIAESTDSASASIESFTEYQSVLKDAINASASATGLTTDQVAALTAEYENLDSFDPAKLFENTLNGIRVNKEELARLNKEVESAKLADYAKKLSDLLGQREDLTAKGADTSAIDSEIAKVQQLMAEYQGLISAYNDWVNAKSGSNERDMYSSIGSSFDEMEKIKNAGWFGDKSLNTFLDLLLNPSVRTGDAEADWENLTKTILDTGHSIKDYWQYDENGLVSDGLFTFLDDVNHVFGDAYARVEDGVDVWDFTGDKLREVADAFGLNEAAIQMFERALIDTGGAVIFDDRSLDMLTGSLKNLNKETGILSDTGIDLDFSATDMSLEEIQAKIQELNDGELQIDANADGAETALAFLDAIELQLAKEYYLKLNAQTNGGLDKASQLISQLQSITGKTQYVNLSVKKQGEVQSIAQELANLPSEVKIAIGIDGQATVDDIISQISKDPESIHVPVAMDLDSSSVDSYQPEDKEATTTYNEEIGSTITPQNKNARIIYDGTIGSLPTPPVLHGTIIYSGSGGSGVRSVHTSGGGRQTIDYAGTMTSIAHADGTMVNAPWNWINAYANGKVAIDENEMALVNELGMESIIRDGHWMMIPGGVHMEALKKGDIILSAAQTKALLNTGTAVGHGRSYATGTLLSNAYDTGTANRRNNYSAASSSNSSSGSKSSGNSNNSDSSDDNEPELFDWIELAIDRIERAIKQLGITAKSTFKTLTTRLEASAEEIVAVTDEIELQQKAYDRYIQQANSVGLSEELAERVRNGAIDINEYDEETQKLIDDYKNWYEKALDCSDAVQQLHEDLAQLYEDRFNDTKDDFDAQLALLEHMTNTFENGMDEIEARGYLMTTKYYEALRDVEKQNIDIMNKELDALVEKMSQAVNSGEIKEYSQSWYDMQQEINDVKEAIQEAETSVIEFGNSIREVLWDRFDYLQDRITEITDEAQFMIDLMEHSDLFTEEGQLTNTGMASMGLHGQNYNTLMNQADRYAEEVKKLNKELANDPYNTILMEQRQEWLEAQRESILNAEDEKQAIVDLVEEGIQKELSYLNDLIDKYKESLDTAKSLYDYQKKVKEQAAAVTRIQKQLSAYSGDNSEEARSTIQKLNVDLSDAMEKLQETQYQRQISDQKEMLSNLYDQYDLILNQRLDNVDALIADMIDVINEHAGDIGNTISTEAKDVGYTLSEAMQNIWNGDGRISSVITLYGDNFVKFGDDFNGKLTTVNETISRIAKYTAKIAGLSDEEAKATVKATTASTKATTVAKPVAPTPKPQTPAKENKQAGRTDQEKYGVAIAVWNGLQGWGAGDDRKKKLEAKGFNYNEIQGIISKIKGDILSGAWNGKYYGITYKDIPNYAYNKFKSGGLVDYTGIAQVDGTPGKPESFLNAEDTKNFMLLRDVLRDIASGKASLSGSAMSLGLFSGIGKVHLPQSQKGFGVGDVTYQINIPIDHVSDYNDLVNKMRTDNKFQNLIQSMTIGQIAGQGSLSKNKYKW